MKLIVGLGNPGRPYAGTRHNIGFEALDALAQRLGWVGGPGEFDRLARSRFDGLALDGLAGFSGGDQKLLLLKPATFMNRSGQSVQAAMAFYQLVADDLMVIVDDLALPAGRVRLRAGGSSGGHNGLRDIERALGTDRYPRLRLGIDAPPPYLDGRDYVLAPFTAEQRRAIGPAIARAADAALVWIERGIEAAMNQFNAGPDES